MPHDDVLHPDDVQALDAIPPHGPPREDRLLEVPSPEPVRVGDRAAPALLELPRDQARQPAGLRQVPHDGRLLARQAHRSSREPASRGTARRAVVPALSYTPDLQRAGEAVPGLPRSTACGAEQLSAMPHTDVLVHPARRDRFPYGIVDTGGLPVLPHDGALPRLRLRPVPLPILRGSGRGLGGIDQRERRILKP